MSLDMDYYSGLTGWGIILRLMGYLVLQILMVVTVIGVTTYLLIFYR